MFYAKCTYNLNGIYLSYYFPLGFNFLNHVAFIEQEFSIIQTLGGFKPENLKIGELKTLDRFNILCNYRIGHWYFCSKKNRNNLFLGYQNNVPIFEPENSKFEIQTNESNLYWCYKVIDYLYLINEYELKYFDSIEPKHNTDSLLRYRKGHLKDNPHTHQTLTQFVEQNNLHEWAYTNPEYVIECLKFFTSDYDSNGSSVVFKTAFKPEELKDGTMFKPVRSNIKFIGLFDKCRFKGEVIIKFKYLKNGTCKTEINFKAL